VGASLRTFTIDGENVTEPYGDDIPTPHGNGVVLVPWPNRIDDGMWVLDGIPQHLDISEPRYHNAIHGLLRFTPYLVSERTTDSITLGATVYPQHGYPFLLYTYVKYELVDDGITVTHTIINAGTDKAPVAIGAHPYLRIGEVPAEKLTVTVSAKSRFESTQRLIPFAEMSVERTPYDLRGGVAVSSLRLDDAFGELTFIDGRATHSIEAPDGRRVELWQDENFGFVQVFTPRNYPRDGKRSLAIAIEPMTSPPNAFVTKRALKWVKPNERWSASWGLHFERGPHA
jgi:aldose 1-epimerase